MERDWTIVPLGPARVRLAPLEPGVWLPLGERHPGPADLCLALLERSRVTWEGIEEPCRPESLARLPAAALEPLLEALCAPWLTPEEKRGLERLEEYLRALADFPGLSCRSCREQQARGEGAPDCARCPLPPPPPEAGITLELYRLARVLPPGAGLGLRELLGPGITPRGLRLWAMRLALVGEVLARGEPGE